MIGELAETVFFFMLTSALNPLQPSKPPTFPLLILRSREGEG